MFARRFFSHSSSIASLLFALLLLCAQLLATAHTVEHALEESNGLPAHACELCLVAHNLGTALTTSALPLLLLAAAFVLHAYFFTGRSALPALQPRQQSPPIL